MKNRFMLKILTALTAVAFFGYSLWPSTPAKSPEVLSEEAWVEQTFNAMTPDERLGQLFMLPAYPRQGPEARDALAETVAQYHIGGLVFFKATAGQIAAQTNFFQAKSKTPMLMAIDGEWGIGMRAVDAMDFPRQLMLGAIREHYPLYDLGREVAKQCRRIGIQVNFAPVVDVNNNPDNPVIGDRSFGEDKTNVTAKSFLYMQGMQDYGVMACAKHFPGHGDTDVDSHKDLPSILHSKKRLDSLELYPFRSLIQNGVQSVMIAHLNIPQLDNRPNRPSTLSKPIVHDLLQQEMGFKGLIFTDALGMKGVTKHFEPGEVEVAALEAGCDVLLMPEDVELAFAKIKVALAEGRLNRADLEKRVKKVLRAKYQLGLHDYKPHKMQDLLKEVNSRSAEELCEELVQQALTLVDNTDDLLPLRRLDTLNMASLSIGRGEKTTFQEELNRYGGIVDFAAEAELSERMYSHFLNKLSEYELVFISLHRMGRLSKDDFRIDQRSIDLIRQLQKRTKVVLVWFGTPYALDLLDDHRWNLVAYNEYVVTQEMAARALMGGNAIEGALPVSVGKKLALGTGARTKARRMPYSSPEREGLNSQILARIDSIAAEAIAAEATPGCQVLVAKNGKIIWHKTYGYHTYEKQRAVSLSDVYDLASVTKVAATTLSIMKLEEMGKLDINRPLSDYLTELRGTNKEGLRIKDILAHQAGLKPWLPFYTRTLDENKRPEKTLYKNYPTNRYCVKVADDLYLCKGAEDSLVWERIARSDLRQSKKYKYSDLGFYLFAKLVERVGGIPLDEFASRHFYRPMGLEATAFNPVEQGISKYRIVPTEEDAYYRYQRIHGYVHDMGAAMLGGVSGHAGLFSTATDLAVIFEMLLNKGVYQDRRYLDEATVERFTAQYKDESRRGLGFDRKEPSSSNPPVSYNVAHNASDNTFGHLGFTGIAAWADPDNDVLFIFLSNRTYPDGGENRKLIKMDIRTRMQEAVYEALHQK